MTAPARPAATAAAVRRRGVLVRAAAVCVCALFALGASACAAGDDGEPAASDEEASSGDGEAGSSTTVASGSTTNPETGSSAGSTAETAPGVPGEVTEPVPIDATADVGDGIEVRLSRIETVEAEATLPGELGGPAIAVTVEVVNGSRDAIGLDHVTVDLATDAGASASPVFDPDREPLAGDLDASDRRSGTYVFTLADEEREDLSVRVRYSVDTPTVIFTGSVRDA